MYRVKVVHSRQVYSLGSKPESFESLIAAIRTAIPSLGRVSSLSVKYEDSEGENVNLTTTFALKEAYRLFDKCLKLSVEAGAPVSCQRVRLDIDELLPVEKAKQMMEALFLLRRNGAVVGAGALIDNSLLITSSSVLPTKEAASQATALFVRTGVEVHLNPTELWYSDSDLVLTKAKQSTHLEILPKLHLDPMVRLSEGDTLQALTGPDFALVKRLVVSNTLQGRLHYQSNQACGLSGSIVFSTQWDPIGVQITNDTTANEVVDAALLLEKLRACTYVPHIYALIERLQPSLSQSEDYQVALQSASKPKQQLVFGLTLKHGACVLAHSLNSTQYEIPLAANPGEGSSICAIPSGFVVSGGKNAVRRAWLYFFGDVQQFFEIEVPTAHYTHASIYFEDKIFFLGGRNSSRAMAVVDSFDFYARKWEKQPALRRDRSYPAVCELSGRMYVFGGKSMAEVLDSIEEYKGQVWTLHPYKLPQPLFGSRVLALSDTVILVCGGCNEMNSSKIFKVDFSTGSFMLQSEDRNLKLANCFSPLYTEAEIAFFNNDGVLFRVRRSDLNVSHLTCEVKCAFE